MWPRKQLDIGWGDLAFGLSQVVAPVARPSAGDVVGTGWVPAEEAVVSLSVRTGWDLVLAALDLPRGSEVITSAVTIPDMVRIIEHHGLVPVATDVDAARLELDVEQLERLITPRTRAILVAHLFGSRVDMTPIVELARRHDLLVIEDCAQAFAGKEYAGHPDCDCSLFSFGPIKTATALGGAVIRVHDPELRARVTKLQSSYPVQARLSYLKRLAKYAMFRLLCKPFNYGLLVRLLGMLGIDYDRALGNAAHSFGANDFFAQIRRQPCTPLLRMLQRRITTFDRRGAARLRRRILRGNQLLRAVSPGMVVGDENPRHTFWVMPVRVANRDEVIAALRTAGFDATARSSLIVVPPSDRTSLDDSPLASWLAETIFLPGGEEMPDDRWEWLLAILQEVASGVPAPARSELLALSGVPVSS